MCGAEGGGDVALSGQSFLGGFGGGERGGWGKGEWVLWKAKMECWIDSVERLKTERFERFCHRRKRIRTSFHYSKGDLQRQSRFFSHIHIPFRSRESCYWYQAIQGRVGDGIAMALEWHWDDGRICIWLSTYSNVHGICMGTMYRESRMLYISRLTRPASCCL